jgi:hypothetical protein
MGGLSVLPLGQQALIIEGKDETQGLSPNMIKHYNDDVNMCPS